jgi:hypothetical protein
VNRPVRSFRKADFRGMSPTQLPPFEGTDQQKRVEPVPGEIHTQNNKEAYSEAGLSGEAALDGNSDTRMG